MTQIIDLGKLRFNYMGTYAVGTTYELNDVVTYNDTLYIYSNAASSAGNLPTNTGYWSKMLTGGAVGTYSENVWYVTPHGVDAAGYGTSMANSFASIKYACQQAALATGGGTIFVKAGTYSEQLPITIPPNVAIVGDNQRTVIVQPKSGNSDDGTTPNAQATMFLMSDGSIVNKMTFKGMTGWVAGSTPSDITTSTVKGVVARLNPASPVTNRSPYVLECAAILSGGIGAYVDGSVHTTGNKSMLFHEYTVISDNGVGYWVNNDARAEVVSCFTYYCYFGYAGTNGGQIRSLSGNNSYGTYGAYSKGYSAAETAQTGAIVGQELVISGFTGSFNAGDTITASSGGTATITNPQTAANKLYVTNATGTFTVSATITSTSGGTATIATGGLRDQRGFLVVMNGFSSLPRAGGGLTFTGDSASYTVQTVSGTWTDVNSVLSLILTNEKTTGSAAGTAGAIRYNFSKVRLTGHDFLNVGTGGVTTTNYPGIPSQSPLQSNEIVESATGRVYYVSTDQDGNLRVGKYFKIDQATGKATLNASAFDLSGLSTLRLGSIGAQVGALIDEFSVDGTFSANSDSKVPTQKAAKTYVDTAVGALLPNRSNMYGAFLKTDGINTLWGSLITISGDTTLSLTTGGTFQSKTYTASNDIGLSGTYTWSMVGAPSQLSLNSSTGVLTATGTIPNGTYNFVIKATITAGHTGYLRVSLYVGANVPMFSTTTPPLNILQSGGALSYTFTQATLSGSTVAHTLYAGSLPSFLTLSSAGVLSGTAPTTAQPSTTYVFTIAATASGYTLYKTFVWTFAVALPVGQALYGTNVGPGTYSWVAPTGVTSVSVVAIGGGAGGSYAWANNAGGGGGLGWKNNITVTPGASYTVVVGAGGLYSYGSSTSSYPGMIGGNSYFISTGTVAGYGGATGLGSGSNANGTPISGDCSYGAGYTGDGGGVGGNAQSYQGGGGAGGYAGYGGRGYTYAGATGGGANGGAYYSSTYGTGAGGGTGLNGQGTSGSRFAFTSDDVNYVYSTSTSSGGGGEGGSGGQNGRQGENGQGYTNWGSNGQIRGGAYGGGGGGPGTSYGGGNGGQGGVRIIWGAGRAFPSTLTADQPTVSF